MLFPVIFNLLHAYESDVSPRLLLQHEACLPASMLHTTMLPTVMIMDPNSLD